MAPNGFGQARRQASQLMHSIMSIIIGGFLRDDEWQTAVGATHLQRGDRVIAVCTSDNLRELQRMILG